MTTLTTPNVTNLRRASRAVYLACEEAVADDISNLLSWAANEIDRLQRTSGEPTLTNGERRDG